MHLFHFREPPAAANKYASQWPTYEQHRPASELTDLGICFLQASGPEKEDLNLELLRAFHPYLYKYLDMIIRGHLPHYGFRTNQDAVKLLMKMIPKGTAINRHTLSRACKHLHPAFKGYEPAEIYNFLATSLLRVIRAYNPFYVEKVKTSWYRDTFRREPNISISAWPPDRSPGYFSGKDLHNYVNYVRSDVWL